MKRASAVAIPASYGTYASEPMVAPRTRTFDPMDLSAKVTIVSLSTLLAVRIGADAVATGRLTGLLMLASEALVVILTVVRRRTGVVDRTWRSRLLMTLSMIGPPLVTPSRVHALLPDLATAAICGVGLVICIAGKLSLGRSFGLLPANRGIVSSGCYRWLRHPIYAGYLLTHAAFLIANPIAWNAILLFTSDAALLRRAVCEEETLARDDHYREYMTRVRWRIVPGLF